MPGGSIMFRECTIRLIQTAPGYEPDSLGRRPERHVVVRLAKAWPLTAPQTAEPAMNWTTGSAMQEWQLQYTQTSAGRAGDPEADPNELWVGTYRVTYNNLNSQHAYEIGNPSSNPNSRIWRYIVNQELEVRLSYFVRMTGESRDRLEDAISLRGATMTKRGFLPPGGEGGRGTGWIERPGPMFNRGLVYWQVN